MLDKNNQVQVIIEPFVMAKVCDLHHCNFIDDSS